MGRRFFHLPASPSERPLAYVVFGLAAMGCLVVYSWHQGLQTDLSYLLSGPQPLTGPVPSNREKATAIFGLPEEGAGNQVAERLHTATGLPFDTLIRARGRLWVETRLAHPSRDAMRVRDALANMGLRDVVSCGPAMFQARVESELRAWGRTAVVGLAVLVLALLATGGGLRNLATTLLAGGAAQGLLLGTWHLLVGPPNLVYIFAAAAGVAFSVLMAKRLSDAAEWSQERAPRRAAGAALRRERGPQLLIAGTVGLAVAAMGASRFQALALAGPWTALACILAVLSNLLVGTAVIALWPYRRTRQATLVRRWLGHAQHRAARWPRLGLLTAGILAASLTWLATRATLSHPLAPKGRTCLVPLTLDVEPGDRRERPLGALVANAARAAGGRVCGPAGQGPTETWRGRVCVFASESVQLRRTAHRIRRAIHERDETALVAVRAPELWLARSGDRLGRAALVALARLLGTVLVVLVALTWDPRLGLTAAAPPAFAVTLLIAVLAALGRPLTLPTLAVLCILAGWGTADAISGILEAARRRQKGSLSHSAASSSMRAATAMAAATAAMAVLGRDSAFASSAVVMASGLLLTSVVSAYGVPTFLAYMPGARFQGPLCEPRRRPSRKR